ncbi:MAG: DUF3336 domain-containing protein [Myxococcales bacterium]|nr:DUF3336 domain-containing protein [Myxococcales bacterium]
MWRRRRQIQRAREALASVRSQPEWAAAARKLDVITGRNAWRNDNRCSAYDHKVMADHIGRLRTARQQRAADALAVCLGETLHRHHLAIREPQVWDGALAGGKRIVSAWLDEVEAAMRWLIGHDSPRLTWDLKLDTLERASLDWGHSALLLSGGAGLGFIHLGVVRTLLQEGLLPQVISGSSMGAGVAAAVCTRTDEELTTLFADTSQLERVGLRWLPPREVLAGRAAFDVGHWADATRRNVGDYTFREAHQRTGRKLNIVVAPLTARQRVRVLNHITAPDVLIASATLASSAIPGLFPPATLKARGSDGIERPWLAEEHFIDGGFWGDLPMLQLRRLFGINHAIVSQANAHVLPLLAIQEGRGPVSAAFDVASALAWGQGRELASIAGRRLPNAKLRRLILETWSIADQVRSGDVTIATRLESSDLRQLLSNPSQQELDAMVLRGARATWRRLPAIRGQTRIARVLADCLDQVMQQGAQA